MRAAGAVGLCLDVVSYSGAASDTASCSWQWEETRPVKLPGIGHRAAVVASLAPKVGPQTD